MVAALAATTMDGPPYTYREAAWRLVTRLGTVHPLVGGVVPPVGEPGAAFELVPLGIRSSTCQGSSGSIFASGSVALPPQTGSRPWPLPGRGVRTRSDPRLPDLLFRRASGYGGH
jgi:hypothetical protein